MRVVYDYGMGTTSARSASPNATLQPSSGDVSGGSSVSRRESVIVISLSAEETEAQSRRSASSDYEVTLSPEARLRDAEVRQHERSHARTLGPHATTPILYDTARGPDGEVVATGGKIGVDLDPVPGDPEATLTKARVVLNAAHAPGSPSAADMRVAAEAYRLAQQAQDEITEQYG
ncbi:MAG: putative metalloprotease CJM1_0395 family protein [Alkalispirochaeta sp.]